MKKIFSDILIQNLEWTISCTQNTRVVFGSGYMGYNILVVEVVGLSYNWDDYPCIAFKDLVAEWLYSVELAPSAPLFKIRATPKFLPIEAVLIWSTP